MYDVCTFYLTFPQLFLQKKKEFLHFKNSNMTANSIKNIISHT